MGIHAFQVIQCKTVYIVSSDTLVENPLIKIYLDGMLQLLRDAAKRDHLPLSVNKVTPRPETSFSLTLAFFATLSGRPLRSNGFRRPNW